MRFALFPILASLILLAACGEEEYRPNTPPEPDPSEAFQIDDLVPALEFAYENLVFERYENSIHAEYVFRVDPQEIDIVGSAELSAVEDLESTEAMFGGETGLEPVIDPLTGLPTGEFRIVAPVQSIEIDLVPLSDSDWEEVTDGEFEGSMYREYFVAMTVVYAGGEIQTIQGRQGFYAAQGTLRGDTSGFLYWQLRAWADLGFAGRGGTHSSIGQLKATF